LGVQKLTHREREILTLVFSGLASKEVAAQLCCSKRTVDFHLSKAYEKLQVANRMQAYRVCEPFLGTALEAA